MTSRSHWRSNERKLRSQLFKFLQHRSFIRGSLVNMARACGNPGCKCARGEKHESLYLAARVSEEGGKTKRKMIYIPPEWEARLREWVETYKKSEDLLEGISAETLKRFLGAKEKSSEKKSSSESHS